MLGGIRLVAVVVIALAVGYLAGGYIGLPEFLDDDTPITAVTLSDSVTDGVGAFTGDCEHRDGAVYVCAVTRDDGSDERFAVTVNREGCWFAQRTTGQLGATTTGRPLHRGCID